MLTKSIKKLVNLYKKNGIRIQIESTPVNLKNKDYIFMDKFLFKSEDS